MLEALSQVQEFHQKFGFVSFKPVKQHRLADARPNRIILSEANNLVLTAKRLKDFAVEMSTKGDERLYRTILMMEELGETMLGMARAEELELADGIADLLYVVLGTAVTFDIPIHTVFREVHRSNMTKARTDHRMENKGQSYAKPDVEKALRNGRAFSDWRNVKYATGTVGGFNNQMYLVDDGERHWVIASSHDDAMKIAAEFNDMTLDEYKRQGPVVEDVEPTRSIKVYQPDQPKIHNAPPSSQTMVYVEATAEEWCRHNPSGILCSTVHM